MNWLEELERKLQAGIGGLAKTVAGAPKEKSLIEICKDVEEDLRSKILAQGRGVRTFPFNRIDLLVFVKDEEQRAAYESVFTGEGGFAERIVAMLAEEGARPRELHTEILVSVDGEQARLDRPYHLRCSRSTVVKPVVDASRKTARLTVLRGQALTPEVLTRADRVNIGRLVEVSATNGSVIRINDLAFDENETTVAREHAFLRWDAAAGAYLLFDALSGTRGTRLFRSGESYTLPKGASKGAQLRHGDEIHLGQARIRFELVDA
jgi:hypothetical protein